MTDLELLFALVKSYSPEMNTGRIERAYEVAAAAHAGQMRPRASPTPLFPSQPPKSLPICIWTRILLFRRSRTMFPKTLSLPIDEIRAAVWR